MRKVVMGFEAIFKFREKTESGEFSEEIQTKKVKIGSPYDEIDLDVLAGKVIAQLAHPKRMIVGVELYEFAKKQLSYKEADDGILIKNKKFKFDDGPLVISGTNDEAPENTLAALLAANPQLLQQLGKFVNPGTEMVVWDDDDDRPRLPTTTPPHLKKRIRNKPIREEIFDPPHPDIVRNERTLTKGKRYGIFEIVVRGKPPAPTKSFYRVKDDRGELTKPLPAEFFTAVGKGVMIGNEPADDAPLNGGGDISLSYGNAYVDDNIPNLRG